MPLAGCSATPARDSAPPRSGPASPAPAVSPPATTPLPALSLLPGAQPPPVSELDWSPGRFGDQVRLTWRLPQGTTNVGSFRIRYLVDGREKVVETEYFFDVLSGLHPGDEVRAFVLARGETGNSQEVESRAWTQP
jgi:hypothetical protein